MQDNIILPSEVVGDIRMPSCNWCVECTEKTPAYYIYKGNSLCGKHFDFARDVK